MKTFLLILALCNTQGTHCIPANGEGATVYEYTRMVDCVRAAEDFRHRFQVEAHCAGDEVSPAEYLKG